MKAEYVLTLMLALASPIAQADTFAQDMTNWLAEVSVHIEREGVALSDEHASIAEELGIEAIDRIRVLVVDELPRPLHYPLLYEEGVSRRLWGPGLEDRAQVFGYGIAVTAVAFRDRGTMAQELMHIKQIERFGSLGAFVEEYLRQVEAHGYLEAPLEREAVALYDSYARSEVGARLRRAGR
jgi:hypothetical protein